MLRPKSDFGAAFQLLGKTTGLTRHIRSLSLLRSLMARRGCHAPYSIRKKIVYRRDMPISFARQNAARRQRESPRRSTHEMLQKVPTGIKGVDEITQGGLPKGRSSLVCGTAGCGKTLFG